MRKKRFLFIIPVIILVGVVSYYFYERWRSHESSPLIRVFGNIEATEVKVSIIGAGSITFSISLVKDLCLTPNLEGRLLLISLSPLRRWGQRFSPRIW
jgi:hypothetical protein